MTRIADASAPGFMWHKSTFSGGQNDCVEAAARALPDALPVRDSKNPSGPAVVFGRAGWSAFVDALKAGDVV
jgi:hypothetical protein